MLSLLNGEPCGYIYFGSGRDGTLRCHQVCIQYDARRKLFGAQLVTALEEEGLKKSATWVRLRCGFDLDANVFWRELGYSCIGKDIGGVRRQRIINIWAKEINAALFSLEHQEPAIGKTSAAFWSKHKQTGIVTQFVRGAAMKHYRATLEGNP